MSPVFETPRLIMTPWTHRDLGAFHVLWSDSEVIWWRGTPLSWAQSREEFTTLLERCREMEDGLGWWRIEARGLGETVGNVLLQRYDNDEVQLGVHIVRRRWRQGIGTEAVLGTALYGFQTLNLPRIIAIVHGANAAGKLILDKVGFNYDGFVMSQGMPNDRYIKDRPPDG